MIKFDEHGLLFTRAAPFVFRWKAYSSDREFQIDESQQLKSFSLLICVLFDLTWQSESFIWLLCVFLCQEFPRLSLHLLCKCSRCYCRFDYTNAIRKERKATWRTHNTNDNVPHHGIVSRHYTIHIQHVSDGFWHISAQFSFSFFSYSGIAN